jgi:hypothetical protein
MKIEPNCIYPKIDFTELSISIPKVNKTTQVGTIVPEADILLNKTNAESWLVHGSCIYNGYIYGVPRVTPYTWAGHNAICKINISDYSDYSAVCMQNSLSQDVGYGEQIVPCGNYLYASVSNPNSSVEGGVLKIDPDTLVHTGLGLRLVVPDGLDSDGIFLYCSRNAIVQKVNPNTLEVFTCTIPDASYNDSTFVSPPSHYSSVLYGDFSYGLGGASHAVLVDDIYIWLNVVTPYVLQAGNQYGSQPSYYLAMTRLHKIRKSDMTYIGYANVAQVTDDMGQDDNYIYLGHEPAGALCYGYTWGTSAVRKSDLAVFSLPKLASSDTTTVTSFGVLRVGNRLINIKTNNHLYTIDITDPSQWSLGSDPNDFVLSDYTINDSFSPFPHNELLIDSNNKFHSFLWCPASAAGLRRLVIPGFN